MLLKNMFKGSTKPSIDFVKPLLPFLLQLLWHEVPAVRADLLWSLCELTRGGGGEAQKMIDALIEFGFHVQFNDMLAAEELLIPNHPRERWVFALAVTLGNLVSGTDANRDAVLATGILYPKKVFHMLKHRKKEIRQAACRVLGNITAGTYDQARTLFTASGKGAKVAEQLVRHRAYDESWNVREEAAWAIGNLLKHRKRNTCYFLYELQVTSLFKDILLNEYSDPNLLIHVMEALEAMFETEGMEGDERYCAAYIGKQCFDDLLEHPDDDVSEKACRLADFFFPEDREDDEEEEDVADLQDAVTSPEQGLPAKVLFPAGELQTYEMPDFRMEYQEITNVMQI
jgi:hypothetical protein